jgi:hypothetical protein
MSMNDEEPFDPESYEPQPTDHGADIEKNTKFQLWIGGIVLAALALMPAWGRSN